MGSQTQKPLKVCRSSNVDYSKNVLISATPEANPQKRHKQTETIKFLANPGYSSLDFVIRMRDLLGTQGSSDNPPSTLQHPYKTHTPPESVL